MSDTQPAYKWDAEDYRAHSGHQEKWGAELIAKLALQGRERVLDIGCGDGKLTARLARAVPQGHVLGLDLSSEMIALAQREYPKGRFPNLTFLQADARTMRLSETFEVIFSNATLHWVLDHESLLPRLRACLAPRGRMLLQMGGKGNAAEILKAFAELTKQPKWRPFLAGMDSPYAFYGVSQYRAWLEQSGFTAQRVEIIPKDMTHKGREELAGWIRTTWLPFLQAVPEELRSDLVSELVEAYVAQHPPDQDGLIHVAMARLEVEAVARDDG